MKKASTHPQPIQLHPENPHYFLFRGQPTILLTSAEHYGAVINLDFDYLPYLDALAEGGLNYTRIYPGAYFETVDYFAKDNPLGPPLGHHILPWARSSVAGYPLGGNKFDLDTWDSAYLDRLKDFVAEAGRRGIIVEICLFNCMYPDLWPKMPLYHENNIQRVGTCSYLDVQTLKDTDLIVRHEAYVRKVTGEVNPFDNVILEVCDEPGLCGLAEGEYHPWLDRMIDVIVETEEGLPHRHLIAQQVCGVLGGPGDFSKDARVSVITGQYVWMTMGGQWGGMRLLELDSVYSLNKPIEENETSYYPIWYEDGDRVGAVRVEAWGFVVGGGAGYNHLNALYSTFNPAARGTGNEAVLDVFKKLKAFMYSFDFIKMGVYFISGGVPSGAFARCICEPGKQYALYIHHSNLIENTRYLVQPGKYQENLILVIPEGKYRAEWIDPAGGQILRSDVFSHGGGNCTLKTPEYSVDMALRIKNVQAS
jgi:hypothetical protein